MDYKIRLAEVLSEILNNSTISIQFLTQIIKKANKNIDADFAINSFALKKYLKQDGLEIAKEIHKSFSSKFLNQNPFIQTILIDGPYLNIKFNCDYASWKKEKINYEQKESVLWPARVILKLRRS